MGELFEEIEHKTFGKDGFDHATEKIASIEQRLGITLFGMLAPPRRDRTIRQSRDDVPAPTKSSKGKLESMARSTLASLPKDFLAHFGSVSTAKSARFAGYTLSAICKPLIGTSEAAELGAAHVTSRL